MKNFEIGKESLQQWLNEIKNKTQPAIIPNAEVVKYKKSKDHYSAYARYKLIAEAFYLTGDIEKYGSGFLRIRDAIALYPTMKIEFREIGGGFMTTVSYTEQKTNTNEEEKFLENKKVLEKVPEKITVNQLAILKNIEQNQHITTSELSAAVKISERKIRENISKLKAKGLIERVGADKGGYWKYVSRIR